MKKKMTLMIVAAGLFVVAIVGGSIAYFTADTRAKNAITAGNLGVELKVDEEKVSQYIENNGLKVSGALPGDRYDYPIYA
ncbi:MAG: TasA family protein [Longibaculum sp.]